MGSHQRFQRFTVRRQNNHRIGGQPGHRNFPSQLPIRHATAPPIRLLFCCRKAASLILPSYLHARAESQLPLGGTSLLPPGAPWFAFGISLHQFPMVAQSVLLGGHVRVGLEDNLYLEKSKLAPSNAALVEKAANIIAILGDHVAT